MASQIVHVFLVSLFVLRINALVVADFVALVTSVSTHALGTTADMDMNTVRLESCDSMMCNPSHCTFMIGWISGIS